MSNSATYPSSFADVHQDDLGKMDGSIGIGEDHAWHPWDYEKREADLARVNAMTTTKVACSKQIKMIACLTSRQNKMPPIGGYIKTGRIDPLHIGNLAWQHWYIKLFNVIQNRSPDQKLTSIKDLEPGPLKDHLAVLHTVKMGRVRSKVIRKLLDHGGMQRADISGLRLTGDCAKKFCRYSFDIISPLITGQDGTDLMLCALSWHTQPNYWQAQNVPRKAVDLDIFLWNC